MQRPQQFHATVSASVTFHYLLYLPEPRRQRWPLVLFLHGAGERGEDLSKLTAHGLPKLAALGQRFPFIIASPQCPADSWWPWEVERLNLFLDHLLARYPVDAQRVYLTGLSMGGYGSWQLALRYPERFAALVPICGGGTALPGLAARLARMPIWAFHGEDDAVVPLGESQRMVAAVNAAGGRARLTVYPGVGHNAWEAAYREPELYSWLVAQRRP